MKTITLKLPTLEYLAEVFDDIRVVAGTGTYIHFGNESDIDLKDLGKTVTLEYSPVDDWTWCVGETSHTGIDTDDLRTMFPRRKFKVPRQYTRVGCHQIRLNDDCNIIVGDHKMTEKEVQEVEELLESRRELKKATK